MPLKINLYHEVLRARHEEQYDPLRLSMMGLVVVVALLAGYYAFALAGKSSVERALSARRAEYDQLVPKMEEAKKQEDELNKRFELANRLKQRIEDRFYWAPVFEQLVAVVPHNVQITRCTGDIAGDAARRCQITIEGLAAGEEPRGVAEELRVLLNERLTAKYKNVSATFKNLEDAKERVTVDGKQLRTASFTIGVQFHPKATPTPAPAQTPKTAKGLVKQDPL
jgi:Tfp pilus assembly protein PilN